MFIKRIFDLLFSFLGLLILFPLFLLISILIIIDSGQPVFFKQLRVGKWRKVFNIYKFRTMKYSNKESDLCFTAIYDKRITRIGKYLRKYKLDELPQLFNIFKGEMSFVGPRPELSRFISHYPDIYDKILTIKPGITDLASIKFRNESSLPQKQNNIEEFYVKTILPGKLKYNLEYIEKQDFFYDLKLIIRTIFAILKI